MYESYKKYGLLFFALFLLLVNTFLFQADWKNSHKKLTFAMLDVGQGDALFIESPTGTQILVDVGPPKKILRELPLVMPFYDKSIDAIIITNPDQDHIGGFSDILKNYKVSKIFSSGTLSDSKTFKNLEAEIESQKIPEILAKKGMRLNLGGGAVIDILFPDRDVSSWTTNDGSVVARLSYGKNSVMLTGDASRETEKIILKNNIKQNLKSDILKVGHHGSHTSTSLDFLKTVSPEYALISVGENNKYGHPHQDVLDNLISFGLKIFRTDKSGAVIMKSDGSEESFLLLK
ncbi:MAG: ComEC/Rec2 family competence protein [Minisyncoccia bacterium]